MRASTPIGVLIDTNIRAVPSSGSFGTWIISPDSNRSSDVYGMLVATDPFGSLWMVPMVDILNDIQLEFRVTEGRAQATIKTPTSAKHDIRRKRTLHTVWHCSACGDGPYSDWQSSCQQCQHKRCQAFPEEEAVI